MSEWVWSAEIYDLDAGMWRLIAEKGKSVLHSMTMNIKLPLNQLSASDDEGASKYNIALLSTSRRAEAQD